MSWPHSQFDLDSPSDRIASEFLQVHFEIAVAVCAEVFGISVECIDGWERVSGCVPAGREFGW
jgi:hypothetical protein